MAATIQIPPLPDTGFVRLPAILARYPISKSSWWAMVRDGRAPASIKLSPMVTAWKASEIRAFLESADTRAVSQ